MVGSRITKRARQDIGGWHGERNLLCLVRPATDCAAFFKANHQSSGKLINRELMSNLRVCVCVLCVCWVSSVRRCTHQLEDNWRIDILCYLYIGPNETTASFITSHRGSLSQCQQCGALHPSILSSLRDVIDLQMHCMIWLSCRH